MKTLISLCIAILALPLAAQITPERLAEDTMLATDVYHVYDYSPAKMTRAPRGYKPVYISHYGRHGERYINRDYYLYPGLAVLKREALTPLGERALKEVSDMVERSEGKWGDLSPLGARNHRAIAERMSKRFRNVFRRGRTVHCESTVKTRCIISMANAGSALAASRPGLKIDYEASEKFLCYIQPEELLDYLRARRDSIYVAQPEALECIKACFVDPASISREELLAVVDAIFFTWKDMPCLGLEPYYIRDFFSAQMLLLLARHYSSWDYCLLSRSPWWHREWLDPITDDIITRAEEALARKDIAADLRFGHDSQLIPLFTLLGITADGSVMGYDNAPDSWDVASVCPMTSNLQIIFYKNSKGSVLVKVLKNEREVSIPALTPVKGPYYRWEDLAELLKTGK